MHFYYPDDVEHNMMRYSFTIGKNAPGYNYTMRVMGKAYIADPSSVKLRLDKHGFWIDGVLLDENNYINGDKYTNQPSRFEWYHTWMDYFLSKPITGLVVGSVEGDNRSWANYIEIKATQVIPNL